MLRKTAVASVIAFVGFLSAVAYADLVVKDGGGVSRTIKNFVCETTKLCNATVLIASDGTEIGTAGAPVRTNPTGTTAQPATQSGTWTVQPGNTANTTPWLVEVDNTLAAITMGDGITTGNFPSGSPVFYGLFNGTTYDRPRSAGPTGTTAVANPAADPCQTTANSTARGSIASATTTRIITPSASNKTYICSVDLLSFAANNVAVVEGTGGTCGSGTAGVIGGTTTGTGISFAAQGGLVKGGAGFFVWNTAGTNVDFCLITSTTGPLSYFVKYVQAP